MWNWLTEIFTDESGEKLKNGLIGYKAKMKDEVNPIERDLQLTIDKMDELTAEWEGLVQDHKAATTKRHKARLQRDIELIENQLDGLEIKRDELKTEVEKITVTDEQVTDFLQWAAEMRRDWEEISQDFESQKMLLERLNITVKLYIDDNGDKKAATKGKFWPDEKVLSIEECNPSTKKRLVAGWRST